MGTLLCRKDDVGNPIPQKSIINNNKIYEIVVLCWNFELVWSVTPSG